MSFISIMRSFVRACVHARVFVFVCESVRNCIHACKC